MKKILSFALVLLFTGSALGAETPWDRKLPFKSATVTYKVGGTMSGAKTLYVEDYGKTTAEYATTTMKMFGMVQDQKEIIITTPDWVYTADLVENTGSKQANINKYMQEEFEKLSAGDRKKVIENAESQGISAVQGLDGSIEKNAVKLLGYSCDKVTAMGTTAYNISGSALPLKIQGETMGIKISQEATKLSTGSVSSSKFALPKGISFDHDPSVDQMMKEQAGTIIRNLAAGKPAMSGTMPQAAGADYSQARPETQVPDNSAGEQTRDPSLDEMTEGVKNLFKSVFD